MLRHIRVNIVRLLTLFRRDRKRGRSCSLAVQIHDTKSTHEIKNVHDVRFMHGSKPAHETDHSLACYQLPFDILVDIIGHVAGNPNELLTCALVNRTFCQIAINFRWADPLRYVQHPLVIETYVQFLSSHERRRCRKRGLKVSKRRKVTCMFNYPKLLKDICLKGLFDAVQSWRLIKEKRNPECSRNGFASVMLWNMLCSLLLKPQARIRFISMGMWKWHDLFVQTQVSELEFVRHLRITHSNSWCLFHQYAQSIVRHNIRRLELDEYALSVLPTSAEQKIFAGFLQSLDRLHEFRAFAFGTLPIAVLSALALRAETLRIVELEYLRFTGYEHDDAVLKGVAACINLLDLTFRSCMGASEKNLASFSKSAFSSLRRLRVIDCTGAWDIAVVNMIDSSRATLTELVFETPRDYESSYADLPSILWCVVKWNLNLECLRVPFRVAEDMQHLRLLLKNNTCRISDLGLFVWRPRLTSGRDVLEWPVMRKRMPECLRRLEVRVGYQDCNHADTFVETVRAVNAPIWCQVECRRY